MAQAGPRRIGYNTYDLRVRLDEAQWLADRGGGGNDSQPQFVVSEGPLLPADGKFVSPWVEKTWAYSTPRLARVVDVGVDGGSWVVEQIGLDTPLSFFPRPLPLGLALRLGAALVDALAEVHKAGSAIGALAPQAVFLSDNYRVTFAPRVFLVRPIRAVAGAVAAPELVDIGAKSPSADVYAAASLLRSLVRSEQRPELEAAVGASLSAEPGQRPSAGELAERLRRHAGRHADSDELRAYLAVDNRYALIMRRVGWVLAAAAPTPRMMLDMCIDWVVSMRERDPKAKAGEAEKYGQALRAWLADTSVTPPSGVEGGPLTELARLITWRWPPNHRREDSSTPYEAAKAEAIRTLAYRLSSSDPSGFEAACEASLIARLALPPEAPDANRLWAELEAVVDRDEAWDSEFTPSPHDPAPARAALSALGEGAVRVAVRHLGDARERMRLQALYLLKALGPRARLAAPHLLDRVSCTRGLELEAAVGAVCAVSLDDAMGDGLLFRKETRAAFMGHVVRHEPLEVKRAYVNRLLDEPFLHHHVLFALVGDGRATSFEGIAAFPELVDPERLSRLVEAEDAGVRAAAARVAGAVGLVPQIGAARLIEAVVSAPEFPNFPLIDLVAPAEGSDRLVPFFVKKRAVTVLTTIAQRRRQAGLETPLAPMRALIEELLAQRKVGTERSVGEAIELLAELRERAALDEAVRAVTKEHERWYGIPEGWHRYLVATGEAKPAFSLDDADAMFLRGEIATFTSAEGAYDALLLAWCDRAHAAFQLAWIARAFGAEVDERRVRWLRELGFSDDEMLRSLQRPVRPLAGFRGEWKPRAPFDAEPEAYRRRAEAMKGAGLPGLAARELDSLALTLERQAEKAEKAEGAASAGRRAEAQERRRERDECLASASLHIERVRRAARR